MIARVTNALRWSALLAALAVSSCNIGINGGETPNSTTQSAGSPIGPSSGKAVFSIGGTVSGLTQSGLVLTASGNTATVASGATAFTLPNLVAAGASYSVAVQSQPVGQTCSVANASGAAQANVTTVSVTCTINTYTIGGIITGLNANGMVLGNGTDRLTVSLASSAFVLHTQVAMGATYAVAVQTQPTGQQCQVLNGTGTMPAAAVTNLIVVCGQWTWVNGSNRAGASGSYGMRGTAASGNVPGARQGAASWIDGAGNLWLFGGSASNGSLNDLWKYGASSGQWTWVSGAATTNASGVYGSQNTAAAGNTPGARVEATASSDSSGNLWLFGGQGYDSAGATGSLNDLWKFNISQGEWTWVSGANTAWASGATPPTGAPGGRSGAVSWIDATGNFWLFGGTGTQGLTNDLWKFVTGMGQWSLITGSQTPSAVGVYGTQGTAAATNVPGSRTQAVASIDTAGNLWLFGGSGYASIGGTGLLNDLWQFNPTSGQWTWMAGWRTINTVSDYGTMSTTDIKEPGARYAATAVADSAGNLWLFGGVGYDSAGARGPLNDAWEYDLGAHQWIWISGSQSSGQAGVYGTLGTGAATDAPGARSGALSWIDAAGNFWLFGGDGLDSAQASGTLNDLWEFNP